ncbi:hypothetical protein CYLTODRAFT_164116 [Cylindrobasidium torrendii FP15055 ss-10]|uniref:Uncharacterized protein n=1 Tax=Cylindrobasidium torrendii FP15055 ss-10 TaxID=1314674 RepID=A0A0D7AZT7_9AGAR|nr:hypothetical protein CYLTODRAFT_164116 [Cylindrobasidium torrendii FP15055 ss-10]
MRQERFTVIQRHPRLHLSPWIRKISLSPQLSSYPLAIPAPSDCILHTIDLNAKAELPNTCSSIPSRNSRSLI